MTLIQFSPSGNTRKVSESIRVALEQDGTATVQLVDITRDENFFSQPRAPKHLEELVAPLRREEMHRERVPQGSNRREPLYRLRCVCSNLPGAPPREERMRRHRRDGGSECIHCFNCVVGCPRKAITLLGERERARAFLKRAIAEHAGKEVPASRLY